MNFSVKKSLLILALLLPVASFALPPADYEGIGIDADSVGDDTICGDSSGWPTVAGATLTTGQTAEYTKYTGPLNIIGDNVTVNCVEVSTSSNPAINVGGDNVDMDNVHVIGSEQFAGILINNDTGTYDRLEVENVDYGIVFDPDGGGTFNYVGVHSLENAGKYAFRMVDSDPGNVPGTLTVSNFRIEANRCFNFVHDTGGDPTTVLTLTNGYCDGGVRSIVYEIYAGSCNSWDVNNVGFAAPSFDFTGQSGITCYPCTDVTDPAAWYGNYDATSPSDPVAINGQECGPYSTGPPDDTDGVGLDACGDTSGWPTAGATTISTPGTTITNQKYTGTVTVAADNVTLQCVQVTTDANTDGIIVNDGVSGYLFEDVEVSSTPGLTNCFDLNGSGIVRTSEVFGCENGITVDADLGAGEEVDIEQLYCHDLFSGASGHSNCVESVGSPGTLDIDDSWLDCTGCQEATVIAASQNGSDFGELFVDNSRIFSGAWVPIAAYAIAGRTCGDVHIVDNLLTSGILGYYLWTGGGPSCDPCAGSGTWLDNTEHDGTTAVLNGGGECEPNLAPVVNDQSFSITEGSSNGTSVGTVVASDSNPGDTLTYSILSGNTNSAFALNSSSGALTVNDSTELVYATTPVYTLNVQVQDDGSGNLTDTADITVNVLEDVLPTGCDCGAVAPDYCTGNGVTYSITEFDRDIDVTFNFECDGGNCKCGTFATGWDYWVAPMTEDGVVTITSMSPAVTGSGQNTENGAMLSPATQTIGQGMFGKENRPSPGVWGADWVPGLQITAPYVVDTGAIGEPTIILKSVAAIGANHSDTTGGSTYCNTERLCLDSVESLTVLQQAPSEPVFRPTVLGGDRTMIPLADIDYSVLPQMPKPPGFTSFDDYKLAVRSPGFKHGGSVDTEQFHPRFNYGDPTGGYPGKVSVVEQVPFTALAFECVGDAECKDKAELARFTVQRGIDYLFAQRDGYCWVGTGGYGHGQLLPILSTIALIDSDGTYASDLNTAIGAVDGAGYDACFSETALVNFGAGRGEYLFGSITLPNCGGASNGDVCADPAGDVDGNPVGFSNRNTGHECFPITHPDYDTVKGETGHNVPNYFGCCNWGPMRGSVAASFVRTDIDDIFPANAEHYRTFVRRVDENGGLYCDAGTSVATPIPQGNGAYVNPLANYLWTQYSICSKTQSCTGQDTMFEVGTPSIVP